MLCHVDWRAAIVNHHYDPWLEHLLSWDSYCWMWPVNDLTLWLALELIAPKDEIEVVSMNHPLLQNDTYTEPLGWIEGYVSLVKFGLVRDDPYWTSRSGYLGTNRDAWAYFLPLRWSWLVQPQIQVTMRKYWDRQHCQSMEQYVVRNPCGCHCLVLLPVSESQDRIVNNEK